jgi:hypothetical protein
MDDKEKDKSVIDKFVDTMSNVLSEVVTAAVMPTRDTKAEAVAEKANEQIFLGDAAVAPEAIPAPRTKKRRAPPKETAPPAKKSVKAPAKKAVSKAAKKSAPTKSAKKTKKAAPKKSKKKR